MLILFFEIFTSIYFLPLFMTCYLQENAHIYIYIYILFLIYERMNMWEFKCYK